MRDTTKTRITRATDTTQRMLAKMRDGAESPVRLADPTVWRKKGIDIVHEHAELATAGLNVPAHGAEYARFMLYFADRLYNNVVTKEMGEAFDNEGVIWRPDDQVHAAHKQIGRMRSDVRSFHPKAETIPLKTIVWAEDPDDFHGRTYVTEHDVEMPMKDSYKDRLVVRVGRRSRSFPVRSLRYVEGAMVRPR